MSLLHVFDMDGTLLQGTTASLEIARRVGCVTELRQLEDAFSGGALDTRGFAYALCRLWANLSAEQVGAAFAEAPWIGGMSNVLADIRARGEWSAVITMSPDFFAGLLGELGVDEVAASAFPALPLRGAPDPAGILTPAAKVAIVERLRASRGLQKTQCIAYGDSHSDIPLFEDLMYTIAINSDRVLRERAWLSYCGDNLWDAYCMVREQLEPDRQPA